MQTDPKTQRLRLENPVRITDQVWPEGTVPVVSVLGITYNHAKFIREAVEGFLMQETTFPVEIVIHDDASDDGTTEVIREYQNRFPGIFRNIIQEVNQFSSGKLLNAGELAQRYCRGEFVALCEGDDYWINPFKLEMQLSALISNPEGSACVHDISIQVEDGLHGNFDSWFANFGDREVLSPEDIISETTPFHTASILFRNFDFKRACQSFGDRTFPSGDLVLFVVLISRGRIFRINKKMSVYRKHSAGITESAVHKSPLIFYANRLAMWKTLRSSFFRIAPDSFNEICSVFERQFVACLWDDYRSLRSVALWFKLVFTSFTFLEAVQIVFVAMVAGLRRLRLRLQRSTV